MQEPKLFALLPDCACTPDGMAIDAEGRLILACSMGIVFGPDGNICICDNQGWSGAPELQFKGRMLRLEYCFNLFLYCKNDTFQKNQVRLSQTVV